MRARKLFWWSLVLVTALALVDAYAGSPTAGWGWDSFITLGRPQMTATGPSAEVSGVVEAPIAPGEVLSVINTRGNVQVTGTDRDGLEARYTITVFADDEAAAARYAEALEVVAVRGREGLELEMVRPAQTPPGVHGVAVDYQIAVPHAVRVQLENGLGRVRVEGVAGPSSVDNEHGETVLRNLQGDWKVRTRRADLQAEQVRGALELSSSYSVGTIREVAGQVTGNFTFGSLAVEEAASVELDVSYTELKLARIGGPIGLTVAFGWAEIEGLRHDLRAKGAYGDITFTLDPVATGFRFDVESRGGDIRNQMAALQGQTVVESGWASQLKAEVGDGAHLVQVSVRNGHVTLR